MTDIVERLRRNSGWRNQNWQCITNPNLLVEAATEIERLRANVKRVQTAARSLDATRTEIYDSYRKATVINTEAVATLDSEREANAVLTEEIERLRKHVEAMAGALGLHLYLNNEERPEPYEEPEDNIYALMRARLAAYRAEYPEEK